MSWLILLLALLVLHVSMCYFVHRKLFSLGGLKTCQTCQAECILLAIMVKVLTSPFKIEFSLLDFHALCLTLRLLHIM